MRVWPDSLVGQIALVSVVVFGVGSVILWLVVSFALNRFAEDIVAQDMRAVLEDLRGELALAQLTGQPPSGPADVAWVWQIEAGTMRYRSELLERTDQWLRLRSREESEDSQPRRMATDAGPLVVVASTVREFAPAPLSAGPREAVSVRYFVGLPVSEQQRMIAEHSAPLRRTAGLILAAMALVLGAALVGVAVLLRRALGRVGEAVAQQSRGETARIDGRYPSEIQRLVDGFNAAMAHNERLVGRTRRYVGKIAHDLKHPLAVARNALNRPGEAAAARTRLDRMAALIDRYAGLARAIGPGVARGPVAAAPVLTEAREGFALVYRPTPVRIEVDCPPELTVRIAREDLEAIVSNLMTNAHKYAASTIRVTAHGDMDGTLVLAVEDDGPGVAAPDRARALDWGERLDEAPAGTGLGLAIVKDIAELYGGDVCLDESPLGGLHAEVRLPDIMA